MMGGSFLCVSRTFTHNMLAFGLSKKLCRDFLKKQAVIGSLNEGTERGGGRWGVTNLPCLSATFTEQYKLLTDHIEKMAAAD